MKLSIVSTLVLISCAIIAAQAFFMKPFDPFGAFNEFDSMMLNNLNALANTGRYHMVNGKNNEMKKDVATKNNEPYVVRFEVPGFDHNDLSLSWSEGDGILEMKGKHECSSGEKYCYEREFNRKVKLANDLDGSQTKAHMKNGILTLAIPKKVQADRKVEIPVSINEDVVETPKMVLQEKTSDVVNELAETIITDVE